MRILIVSDSHGHIANIKAVMEIAKKSEVKAVVHCGDWHDIKSVETLLSFGLPLYTVLGNADVEDGMEEFLKFNATDFNPDFLKIDIEGRKVGITHRIKKDDNRFVGLNVVFSGHYHSSEVKTVNWTKFIRPGAIINGINFAVYETVTGEVEFVTDKSVD